jgi:hypothetical protein
MEDGMVETIEIYFIFSAATTLHRFESTIVTDQIAAAAYRDKLYRSSTGRDHLKTTT